MPRGVRNTQAAPKQAKNNPVMRTTADPVSQSDIGQGATRLMKSTGPARDSLETPKIALASEFGVDQEKLDMLAFMNELVTIRIATTTDKNAEPVFEINVNGNLEFFRRGETKTVKRFIVDRMMRLKVTAYDQKEVLNAEGIKDIIQIPRTALKYDFSIERDDNPMGESWKRHTLAQAG